MADALRSNLIRLASSYPQGSEDRKKVLALLKEAEFPPGSIGEPVSGPTGVPGSDAQKPWSKGEFTQQEFMELTEKQESGEVGDGKPDDGPMRVASEERPLFNALVRLANSNTQARGPILGMLRDAGYIPKSAKKGEEQDACGEEMMGGKKKEAGCEKLPPALRENCEKKKDEGEDKKEASLRAAVIRLASEKPEFRSRLLPVIKAHDSRE